MASTSYIREFIVDNAIDRKPNVLCFSGLDPSGGAGIQADIEALFSCGCHCLPLVTTLTVQDTRNAISAHAVEPTLLIAQARAILEDVPVQAFKIGLLSSIRTVEVIHTLLIDYPDVPVVLDPVIRAGGGYTFGGEDMVDAFHSLLLPLTTVVTPNSEELRHLSPNADCPDACAHELLDRGCDYVLLTGTHANTPNVVNRLYSSHGLVRSYQWPRLNNEYHGSGCTMAACMAGYLAHGLEVSEAAQQAQQFTWDSLNNGIRTGMGQLLPNRSHWTN